MILPDGLVAYVWSLLLVAIIPDGGFRPVLLFFNSPGYFLAIPPFDAAHPRSYSGDFAQRAVRTSAKAAAAAR